MNIFDKRPFLLILTTLIGGFVMFTFSGKILRGLLIGSAILLICLSLILFFKKISKNKLIIVLPIILLFSILLSHIYFDLYFDLYKQYDESVEIEGTIVSVENYDYTSKVIIKTSKIDCQRKPNYKVLLNASKTQIDEQYVIGTVVSFKAKLGEFENFSDIDANSYYFAKGINATATDVGKIKIIGTNKVPLAETFNQLRMRIVNRMVGLSDESSAYLFSALFLGERDLLSDQIKLDFKVLGITHILALSGLHLSIIAAALEKLLSLLRVKKKPRLIIISIIVLCYMMLTGLSISIVRAGIMIIIYSALFLLGKTKDSLTSLAISVLLILLFSPYAIYDLTLWLSALSTFGVIVMQELKPYKKATTITEKIIKLCLDSLASSIFAISATILITSTVFGTISIVSPFSTLVFAFLAEVIIYLGILVLIFGNIIPFGKALDFVSNATSELSSILSEPDLIYVTADSVLIKILIITYTVVFILFVILNFTDKRKVACILVASLAFLLISSSVASAIQNNKDKAIYYNNEFGDSVLLQNNSQTTLITSLNYTSSSAYNSFDIMSEYHITHLDNYYITNYSRYLVSNVEKLLSLIRMDIIYLPAPTNESEEYILDDIECILENYNVRLYIYENEEAIVISKYTIKSIYRTNIDDKSRKNAFTISDGENICLYLSSGMLEGDTAFLSLHKILKSHIIIFGGYGTTYSDNRQLDAFNSDISSIIICSKKFSIEYNISNLYNKNGTEIIDSSTVVNIFN